MTHNEATLLVEIGVEEIPSRFLRGLADDFAARFERALREARISCQDARRWFTPRRMVFQARVARAQAADVETVRGPAVSAAYQDGEPTAALYGFLRRVNLTSDALTRDTVGGREYVTASVSKPVDSAARAIPGLIAGVLATLPQPRSMRWGSDDTRFIRPIRWIVVLLDDEVLHGSAMGVAFGNQTFGNRTDCPAALTVARVEDYWEALGRGVVMVDADEREAAIRSQARGLAERYGGTADIDPTLMAEVTNLIEWPTPFLGTFDESFLSIPEPILVTSMRVHQRYFPVRGMDGQLMHYFIAVRNGIGEDLDAVRHGNEKVLRARLSDARYFFSHDIAAPLASHLPKLSGVTIHDKLGTYQDKADRMMRLLERTRGWWNLSPSQLDAVTRAIALYKCDLLTQVVGEFPELQGEMGAIYAQRDGEDAQVVEAIRDQYRPASIGDRLPESPVAQLLGLMDRVDTLCAFYQADIRATGSEDPFGLRRAAMGAARLAVETDIMAGRTMHQLVGAAAAETGGGALVAREVLNLVTSRLVSHWEVQWPSRLLLAVLAREFPWSDLSRRLVFFRDHSSDLDTLSQTYKRVARIVASAPLRDDPGSVLRGVEGELNAACIKTETAVGLEDWWDAAQEMVPVVTRLFDEVLVMDPDETVRERRVALLRRVLHVLSRYCDWDVL